MLDLQVQGPVARLTLNRPEVRNALSGRLIAELHQSLVSLPKDVRVVVLTGAGSAFCAGGDLEWMQRAANYTEEQNFEDAMRLAELFEAIAHHQAVVIAAVNGHAFGGGAGLVAACDIAVCASGALFAFSEVKLGLIPATISRYVLPKIGPGHARALFTTGEAFGAEVALRIGLVHSVAEDLTTAVDAKVAQVLAVGPNAAHQCKLLAQNGFKEVADGARALAAIRAGEEGREGVRAFLEKRPASFVVKP